VTKGSTHPKCANPASKCPFYLQDTAHTAEGSISSIRYNPHFDKMFRGRILHGCTPERFALAVSGTLQATKTLCRVSPQVSTANDSNSKDY
jgi:hypothetical protein